MTVVEVPQTTKNLSEPMKWIEAALGAGTLHHDGNPAMAWMCANVTTKPDPRDNIFPRKERRENKIDGATAMIIAVARAVAVAEKVMVSPYKHRGVITL
jgi:phage terminase large subunit-like protein